MLTARSLSSWDTSRPIIRPFGLRLGDTIGVFTPSSPYDAFLGRDAILSRSQGQDIAS